MEDKYKIFPEAHSKMLELVEKVDGRLAEKYQKVVEILPKGVIKKLKTKKEFSCEAETTRTDYDGYSTMIELQHICYGKKYLAYSINLYAFYEDELEDNCQDICVFSLNIRNTDQSASIRFNVEEVNGNYKLIGTQLKGLEIDYKVNIESKSGKFYLVMIKSLNNVDIDRKEQEISYDELKTFALKEKSFDEDYEDTFKFMEFNVDENFDLN